MGIITHLVVPSGDTDDLLVSAEGRHDPCGEIGRTATICQLKQGVQVDAAIVRQFRR
jgi:hypothetical protein